MAGKRYRKVATIEAEQFWPDQEPWPEGVIEDPSPHVTASWWIETLEGGHVVTPGDWIAVGVQGERWPIKPDVFAATYVEDDGTDLHAQLRERDEQIERLRAALRKLLPPMRSPRTALERIQHWEPQEVQEARELLGDDG